MEACQRCGGKGRVKSPSRFSTALTPQWIMGRCPVCLGMKVQQPKRSYPPPRLEVYWSTPLTNEELDDLLKSLEVSDDDN